MAKTLKNILYVRWCSYDLDISLRCTCIISLFVLFHQNKKNYNGRSFNSRHFINYKSNGTIFLNSWKWFCLKLNFLVLWCLCCDCLISWFLLLHSCPVELNHISCKEKGYKDFYYFPFNEHIHHNFETTLILELLLKNEYAKTIKKITFPRSSIF